MKRVIFGLGCLVLGIFLGLVIWKRGDGQIISPLGLWRNEPEKKNGIMLGFLPTWMVGKTKMYGKEVDQLVFLGIEVRENGSLVWDLQSKKLDGEAYLKQKMNIFNNGGKNIVGIKLFEDNKIDSLIASSEAKKRLLNEVDTVVAEGRFDGVNIDFEYMSNPTRVLDADFVAFLDEIRQYNWGEVSIDVFANTVIKGGPERLNRMLESVDRVVVMAYDFHRPGADFAGPVAPINAEEGERSISEIMAKIVEADLEKNKMIMAYPLYGYEWETDTNEMGSATRDVGYGKTVFYEEGVGFTGAMWGELSQSPWVAWQEEAKRSRIVRRKVGKVYKNVTVYFMVDQWHQAYFEDERSLNIKIDLAREAKVGGVGFWALGYEGKESNLISDLGNRLRE